MKKLMFLALSFVISASIYGHGFNTPNYGNELDNEGWQQMNEIRELMHYSKIDGEKTDNGVQFEITSKTESAVKSINKRFVEEKDRLEDFFKGLDVKVNKLDDGVKLNLQSDDNRVVQRLQAQGYYPVIQYLHSGIDSRGFGPGMMYGNRGGYGPGMMHGYGPGMMNGYGPGMMQGYGPGMGYAPCGRGGNYNQGGSRNAPGSMHWDNQNENGYGPGMMMDQ